MVVNTRRANQRRPVAGGTRRRAPTRRATRARSPLAEEDPNDNGHNGVEADGDGPESSLKAGAPTTVVWAEPVPAAEARVMVADPRMKGPTSTGPTRSVPRREDPSRSTLASQSPGRP